jgi:selenocysteine-specific elongation factor
VHVNHGTREVLGRVLLMDAERLLPGESGLAQLRLEEPIAPRYDDRFIVRSYSPVYTIGGGVVLDAMPPRRTRLSDHERELLQALLAHDLSRASVGLLASRHMPMTSAEVAAALGVPRAMVADELNRAKLERLKVGGETAFVTADALDGFVAAIERELLAFHAENPKATGVATSALRDAVDRRLAPRAFDAVLEVAVRRGVVAVEAGQARHTKAAVSAMAAEQTAAAALLPLLQRQGLAPETVSQLAAETGTDARVARKVLGRLASEGAVVRISSELHFSAEAMAGARAALVAHLQAHPEGATAADLRDALGVSRKYAIPLLEYFDAQGLTRRTGDVRVLRKV